MGISREDRRALGFGAWVFALFAVVFAFGAFWVAAAALGRSNDARTDAAKANAPKVTETEFKLDPNVVGATVGGQIVAVNGGKIAHNLAIEGTDLVTSDIQPGKSALLSLKGLEEGTYVMYCKIPGHASSGMKGTVTIGKGGMASGNGAAQEAALRKQNARDDQSNLDVVTTYVGQLENGPNTEGIGNQPLAPEVLPDGTKEFKLTAKVVDWEVAPGQTVRAWTYNGMVPGPMIQVNPGDRVRVTLRNELPQSTEIHFHGLETPNAVDGVPYVTNKGPIKPGQTYSYNFTAQSTPAVGMYHSHHHAEHQVPDGLAGVFLVGSEPIPAGFGTPSQVVPMVLNDAGVIGLSLNGKSFPATLPVMAKANETVEIHYFNEGLQIHPMHLHGLAQTIIARDGFPLANPERADTVNVAPGQRVTVLVRARPDQTGVWAFHCHILNHAEKDDGMFGMVTTFIVS